MTPASKITYKFREYVNTLMLQDVLAEPAWTELLTSGDRRVSLDGLGLVTAPLFNTATTPGKSPHPKGTSISPRSPLRGGPFRAQPKPQTACLVGLGRSPVPLRVPAGGQGLASARCL
jgi:hypothetical protein